MQKITITLVFMCFPSLIVQGQYTLQDHDVEIENGKIITCNTSISDWGTGDIIIPDSLCSQQVIAIGEECFREKEITSLLLPSKLEIIEKYAFSYNLLQTLLLPNSVTYIGSYAFYVNNNLKSVVLPNGIDTLRECTFVHCALESISIPNSVVLIDLTFSGNSIKELYIPNSVEAIHKKSFIDNKLTKVSFEENSHLTYIGASVFARNSALTSVILPSSVIKEGYYFSNWQREFGDDPTPITTITDFSLSYVAKFTNFTNYHVSGKITINSASGVTLVISGDISETQTVDINGYFNVPLNAGRNVVITPVKEGYVFTPENIVVDNIQANMEDVNFVGELTSEIGFYNNEKIINVYPNPANNKLVIENKHENANIEVYNSQGMLMLQNQLKLHQNQLDISMLNQGVYILKIRSSKINLNFHIVKK